MKATTIATCADCGKRITRDTPKGVVGGRLTCGDCLYQREHERDRARQALQPRDAAG